MEKTMYIKIPINLLHDNPFNSINECLFYAFCASHTKEETMTFNYSNEKLQKVFPMSTSQFTRYLNNLVNLGIAEDKSYTLSYSGVKCVRKRNYKVNTRMGKLVWDEPNNSPSTCFHLHKLYLPRYA